MLDSVARVYRQFARYPVPANLWVCEQCEPQWSAESVRATPLGSISLSQLCAVHVMALDDDALRHFFPRLIEVMLETPGPVFDFRLADLKSRLPAWEPDERDAVRGLAEAVWSQLMGCYPCDLGYFGDCPSAVDLLDWCGLDLGAHLDHLLIVETQAAARHLADLIDAVLTMREPFESAPKEVVLDWLRDPVVGERLQSAFFAADSDEVTAQLSNAHELWTVCVS